MTPTFETDRLLLRDWNPEGEAEWALQIYGDPEVMRYIGDGQTIPDGETMRLRLQQRLDLNRRLSNGTGFWAIAEKSTRHPVGTVILKQLPDGEGNPTPDWEVGWHLRRASWGQGYVTEAARPVMAYGFHVLKLPVIYAVVHPDNGRSQRVTQRLGMVPLGTTGQYYGREVLLFALRP
ncbi:MAG: GNAT family N-acetyltransferase [Synechococcales bacterium]|nr:GNAT family N-acetyltransferase [Synechococcales bacterium]